MLAEIWVYGIALVGNWAALIWGTWLIFDVGGLVLKKAQYLAVSDFLDRYTISEDKRVLFFRSLLLIGLLIAGFNAWDEQYRTALKNQAANERSSRIYDPVTEQTFLCDDSQGSKAAFCVNPGTGAKVPRPTAGYPAHDLSREQMFHLNAGFARAASLFAAGTGNTIGPTCWVTIHAAADNQEFAVLVEAISNTSGCGAEVRPAPTPTPIPDAYATPVASATPLPYIVVSAPDQPQYVSDAADTLVGQFRGLLLDARRAHSPNTYDPQYPIQHPINIDLGELRPWSSQQ